MHSYANKSPGVLQFSCFLELKNVYIYFGWINYPRLKAPWKLEDFLHFMNVD